MAAYRRVYDSRHLQADRDQEPASAPEPYATLLFFTIFKLFNRKKTVLCNVAICSEREINSVVKTTLGSVELRCILYYNHLTASFPGQPG